MSWVETDDGRVQFEVQAASAREDLADPDQWVAVGFSRDDGMGEVG